MTKTRKLTLALAMGLGVGLGLIALVLALPRGGLAQPAVAGQSSGSRSAVALTGRAPLPSAGEAATAPPRVGRITNVDGSSVTMDDCYQADKTQTFCFTVHNGSTDGEWLDEITLTFPDDPSPSLPAWTVSACVDQDSKDSVGYPVSFSCTPSGRQVMYQDNDSDGFGEISSGSSWSACVAVIVPPDYAGDRYVTWVLHGDASGSDSGSIKIEKCTPLTLKPSQVIITGCNGTTQTLEFRLENYAAGDTDVDLAYDAPAADFGGQTSLHVNQGEVVTFTAELEPSLCLEPGEEITASLTVEGNGHVDTSLITQTISESAGWRRRDDSPVASMDNVVVWASHRDGGLWSIGGYGSDGATQRYDPTDGSWATFEPETVITPPIEYPMDGCYGLDGSDPDTAHEIVVLFPDTIVTDSLHVYDITANRWYTEPIPGFFPPDYEGRWGYDVVSLLNNPAVKPGVTDKNVCYLSGGSPQVGGGRTRDLWEYHPDTNSGRHLNKFFFPPNVEVWFGFHASWYVPWVGDDGAICVAGGADHNHQINHHTQCFDLATEAFNVVDADLGILPEPWWGMADGWQIQDGNYQLWIANGVAQDGTLLPVSAYIQEGMSTFEYGPGVPQALYRLEGDAWEDQFYTLNGSRGGFWYSPYSLHLAPCPTCQRVFLPLVLRRPGW